MKPYIRPIFLLLLFVVPGLTSCSAEMKKGRWLQRAERNFEAGEYDKAKIDYLKVAQIDPQNTVAFQQLGLIWLEEGAPLRAGPFLRRAAELAPKDAANRVRLARVYHAVGQQAEARKELLAVLEQSPDHGDGLLMLSGLATAPEDIAAVEQALAQFPNKDGFHFLLATANIGLRKSDLPAARQAVEKAITIAPKSPEVLRAAGILDIVGNNPKAAAAKFKQAAELAPTRSDFQIDYAEYVRQTEGGDAARPLLKNITDKAPDYLPAWILLGKIAFSEKKFEEALGSLENVFSRDPQNIDARLLHCDVLLAQRQPQKAIEELERLDAAYLALPPVRYRLAQAYALENKTAQAITVLDEVITKQPAYTEAILYRAQLDIQRGNAAAAIAPLEEIVKSPLASKAAPVFLADAYRATGRLEDAANIFREQIKTTPSALEPHFFLGMLARQQAKTDDARRSFEKVLELSPDNLLAVGQLVDMDLQAKDFAAAGRRVQTQMDKHPEMAALHLLEAKVRLAKGERNEAEAALKKAIERNPEMTAAYDMLVSSYIATDRLPEAVQELESLIAKFPKNEGALMTLGVIREKQKDYPKARDVYEKLLALNPDALGALNNLSYLYAERLGEPDKALELARKARTVDSANPAVADTLGWALFKRGEYQQALTLLQEAADKVPDSSEIAFHVGMAHYMMGQTDAARSAFQRALSSTEDFPSKSDAQNRLALLGAEAGQEQSMTVEQLEQLLGEQPNDLVARLRLAEAYEKQSAWANAVGAYEAALKLNPKLASVALKLAQLYSGPSLNKEKALSYAKMARELSPVDRNVTAVLGRVAFDTGDYAWAYNLLQESARQSDADAEVLHDFAWAAYSLGKLEEARQVMERAVNASPAPAIAEDAKSFLALTSVDAPPAADLKSAVESKLQKDAKYVPALMAAANLDVQSGAKPKAIERYQTVLQQFPDFTPAQYRLAALYADDPAHLADAYDLASKARKSRPDDPAVAQLLGQLSYQRKDYSRALQLLEESARKKPLEPAGMYYLGVAQMETKNVAKGVETLEGALASGLEKSLSDDAAARVEKAKRPKDAK